ncbi:hypothetical protein GEMRC1_008677 [Eukaryota sp. GEM-RC1]
MSFADYKGIYDSCIGLASIYEITSSCKETIDFFNSFVVFYQDLVNIHDLLENTIDFLQTTQNQKFTARTGFNKELDDLRHQYNTLEHFLTDAAQEELESIPSDGVISSVNVVYYPQLGFLVAVDLQEHEHVPDYFEIQFTTTDFAYFKTPNCRNLDISTGDIHSIISDLELDIERQLLDDIEPYLSESFEFSFSCS